jgi:hypothetical protein
MSTLRSRPGARVCVAAYARILFHSVRSAGTQVLELLHSCAKEFADDVLQVARTSKAWFAQRMTMFLQAYSDTILLALVTRLVNETSRGVKAMVVEVNQTC